jgi:hypothetical protein
VIDVSLPEWSGRFPGRSVRPSLEPHEALAGPLFAVAALFVVVPIYDFLLSAPPVDLASVEWRFATASLLSGHALTPILGLSLALGIAGVQKWRRLEWVLVIVCLTSGVLLLAVSASFLLDAQQLRASVPVDGRPAFNSAWHRALLTQALSAVVLVALGWGARRMIPARVRHRGHKPVHVVSK